MGYWTCASDLRQIQLHWLELQAVRLLDQQTVRDLLDGESATQRLEVADLQHPNVLLGRRGSPGGLVHGPA